MKLHGIAASPGIALGPMVRYEREELAVRDTPIAADGVDAEIERFHAALNLSRHDLTRIRDGIAHELGEHEAAIYDAHLMILDDPELRRAVEEGIRTGLRNAASVFRGHIAGVAAHMEHIEDEYLRERRADLLDVERRVLRHLLGRAGPRAALAAMREPSIIVAHDLGPSEVAMLDRDRVLAFVTEVGGRTSHGAIVARGRGIPAVVSARNVLQHVRAGDHGAVDGYAGVVEVNPDAETTEHFRARRAQMDEEAQALGEIHDDPCVTLDGHRVELGANIELPAEVEHVLTAGADSVGLFRTEFFYLNRVELPTEEEQYQAYRGVAEKLGTRPVIFRTMDLGGDKVASYLGMTHETNPFLGWRGIRFALHHPEVFRAQIRAIYRASAHGRVRMMFPMVSSEDELLGALTLCSEVQQDLGRRSVPHDAALEIGVMIETPSSVWMADVLARHVRFLSVGSNDLTQYTLAIDRDNERLAHLYEPLDPAVLRSIAHTVAAGRAAKCWVGICGEMAGDPSTAVLLVGLGLDELSMSSFDLPRVKAAIRSVRLTDAERLAREALAQSSARGVKDLLAQRADTLLPSFLLSRRSPS
jgi:phosphotransferase system enzyme I (PtsI)